PFVSRVNKFFVLREIFFSLPTTRWRGGALCSLSLLLSTGFFHSSKFSSELFEKPLCEAVLCASSPPMSSSFFHVLTLLKTSSLAETAF
ncbi:MAG: hypothetical protein IJD16_04125, partial [Desulfovibrio sp.]|nr:hypothetical protein [Desulfovibrio sp.]